MSNTKLDLFPYFHHLRQRLRLDERDTGTTAYCSGYVTLQYKLSNGHKQKFYILLKNYNGKQETETKLRLFTAEKDSLTRFAHMFFRHENEQLHMIRCKT
jgi:tRNA(Phe) wybutosine-synthesizing methylase Tyw3